MFIITDRAVFAPYEDHSNEFRNEYYTEVDLTTLVISEDLTMRPAYYQVFREYKENKRILREWLYASSELSKIKSFINKYLSHAKKLGISKMSFALGSQSIKHRVPLVCVIAMHSRCMRLPAVCVRIALTS